MILELENETTTHADMEMKRNFQKHLNYGNKTNRENSIKIMHRHRNQQNKSNSHPKLYSFIHTCIQCVVAHKYTT